MTVPDFPPPEVTATPVDPEDLRVPTKARSHAKHALAQGWDVRLTYARGTVCDGNGEPAIKKKRVALEDAERQDKKYEMVPVGILVVDSILLRARHPDGRQVSALWHDKGFEAGYARKPGRPVVKVGGNDIKGKLTPTDDWDYADSSTPENGAAQ